MDPQPFFLACHRLGEELYRLREKVVSAFWKIDYEKLTPLMTKVFGSTFPSTYLWLPSPNKEIIAT